MELIRVGLHKQLRRYSRGENQSMARSLFLIFLLSLLSTSHAAQNSEYRQVVEKNYKIGEKTFAYVGDPVVKVKDYWVRQSHFSSLKSPVSFEVSRSIFGVLARVSADTDIPVISTKPDGSKRVQLPTMPGVQLIVDADGRFTGKAVSTGGMPMGFKYKITPEVTLTPSVGTITEPNKGYTNFEILYGGVTKDEIKLSYREYTPDNVARPAFSQELAYSPGSATIRFRKIVLAIESVDNEKIVYSVISDGF
jgi:hypothetical protein